MKSEKSLIAIESLVADYDYVKKQVFSEDVSIAQNLQRHLTKMLILSCASYYENTICSAIKRYSQRHSEEYKESPHGFEMIEGQSFFKMFDFGRDQLHNVRKFLRPVSFLGKAFRDALSGEISEDQNKESNLHAFQEICSMRNSLAHNDLIVYSDESAKSFEDIKYLHDKAIKFVTLFRQKLE